MGKNRTSTTSNESTILNKLRGSAIEWITHIVDFIDEGMTQEEIDYVNNHLTDIEEFSQNGIYRSENSSRTFDQFNLEVGKTFSFDNGEFKAFSKESDMSNQFSLDTLMLGGKSTIFHLNKGNAFDVSQLEINDVLQEQEVWVSSKQQFKVERITKTTLEEMNYNKNNSIPVNVWNKVKDKEIQLVEISEV